MERTVLLMKPEQRKKLSHIAKKEKTSLSEINRRAIDFYLETSPEELATLSHLMKELAKSNQKAQKALESTESELRKTLKSIKSSREYSDPIV
jgi:chromosomal replication initiation ATPase DnaA